MNAGLLLRKNKGAIELVPWDSTSLNLSTGSPQVDLNIQTGKTLR